MAFGNMFTNWTLLAPREELRISVQLHQRWKDQRRTAAKEQGEDKAAGVHRQAWALGNAIMDEGAQYIAPNKHPEVRPAAIVLRKSSLARATPVRPCTP